MTFVGRFFLLLLLGTGQLAAQCPGDAPVNCELARGAFNKCRTCHSLEPGSHGVGPSLHGLAGRRAGSVEGFRFSKALRKADRNWNAAELDAFLKDPLNTLPRNRMAFAGLKNDAERAALICLLLQPDTCPPQGDEQ